MYRLWPAITDRHPTRKGFTLIEVVIAISILGIIGFMFVDSLTLATESLSLFQRRQDTVYEVQHTLKRMLKDFRYIRRGGINMAESARFSFEDSFGRTVYLRHSGIIVEMSLDNINFHVLAKDIDLLAFRYFDKYNNELVSPVTGNNLANIHWLKVEVTASKELMTYTETMEVFPREMFR